MKLKQWQNIFPVIVSANWSIQNVIQNKSGMIKHVNVNVKIIVSAKAIIAGILAYVFVRMITI